MCSAEFLIIFDNLLTGLSSKEGQCSSDAVQIIGMSATLPNIEMLAQWLNADLYVTDFRPVPLIELMKVGKTVTDADLQTISEINEADVVKGDEEHVIPLCLETIREGNSVLIFCPTKNWCEKLAKTIADHFQKLLGESGSNGGVNDKRHQRTTAPPKLAEFVNRPAILEILEQLSRSPVGLDKALSAVVSNAVSFHHAGLTIDERDVVENAFKKGVIKVLIATSTLSSGTCYWDDVVLVCSFPFPKLNHFLPTTTIFKL